MHARFSGPLTAASMIQRWIAASALAGLAMGASSTPATDSGEPRRIAVSAEFTPVHALATTVTRSTPASLIAAPAAANSSTSASPLFVSRRAHTPPWVPPIAPPVQIMTKFDPPPSPYAAGHRGVDLATSPGDLIFAPADGVVSFSGLVAGRPVVSLRIDDSTVVSIEPVSSTLAAGDVLSRGDVWGSVADGGHCGERCVHLGVRVTGEYVNPLHFYWGRPALLPWRD